MHKEILSREQAALAPWLGTFKRNFGLGGGTAIALQLGHRKSLDFDLFTNVSFDNLRIIRKIRESYRIEKTLVDAQDELTIVVRGVKLTFLHYPFLITFPKPFIAGLGMSDLTTLGALKAYALGRRAKWKDYVDLYFLFKHGLTLQKISAKARRIFRKAFNEKLFRAQLAYYEGIDYSEQVDFMDGFEVGKEIIQKELLELSIS